MKPFERWSFVFEPQSDDSIVNDHVQVEVHGAVAMMISTWTTFSVLFVWFSIQNSYTVEWSRAVFVFEFTFGDTRHSLTPTSLAPVTMSRHALLNPLTNSETTVYNTAAVYSISMHSRCATVINATHRFVAEYTRLPIRWTNINRVLELCRLALVLWFFTILV
ncbi:hypothetical protein BCR34DRAFT_118525 [Clohesyomyces aquaticus]|uniref:Uncharacterized protein n=1 Tax=Clohesyomyces aquaticus TaxID=1231657 RepID=A0A1Y2A132_9PLEO|nr:hypothetical protein BCR34DRAFT_118525 [Clohesyomyces aquaticus]